jgi:N-acetylglucosaminyldiphosphoundecaprenol N-acetyl-beta-D-mannosaminyltransferase
MAYKILGMRIDTESYETTVHKVSLWAQHRESRYVCVAAVHIIMEGYDSLEIRQVANGADLVVPDGMPLVWTLRRMGVTGQERVYGPELTLRLLAAAEEKGIAVGFFGSTPDTLDVLVKNVHQRFPGGNIAYTCSPPFRPLSAEEDESLVKTINNSGVRILFVGLGCPKQEKWMAAHAGRVNAVMVGVGAAFDFIAGTKQQAPKWMQRVGLEWFFRLVQEPGRLWWRYLYHNPRFMFLVMLPLFFRRSH